jgi:flagellin-like hook-associated protein FlgL
MVVRHNLAAENALRYDGTNKSKLGKSLEKLSSGFKINRAGDNAAGLAVSEKMRTQLRGIEQAVNNAQDGISMVQTFEGALTESHNILMRMKTLAAQSANGTYDDQVDRAAIELEYEQLCKELDDISETDFNGVRVLNVDGTSGTQINAPTYTLDLSALDGTDFGTQFEESFLDARINIMSRPISAEYEAPASPVELSSGGAVSFAYNMDSDSAEVVFDVICDGKSIGQGIYDFEDFVMGADTTVNLTGTGGEDFGKIKLNFESIQNVFAELYLTEQPVINSTALSELAQAIESIDEGDAEYEVTYTPATDFPTRLNSIDITSSVDDNAQKNFKIYIANSSLKLITFDLMGDVGELAGFYGNPSDSLSGLTNPGDSKIFDGGSAGKFTITLKNGTVGNFKPTYTSVETSSVPYSLFKLEKRVTPHIAITKTAITGMTATPTEKAEESGGGDPGMTPPSTGTGSTDVTATATGVALQVGARTKDLKTFDFDYSGVWLNPGLQEKAIGDLKANINASASGLGLGACDG